MPLKGFRSGVIGSVKFSLVSHLGISHTSFKSHYLQAWHFFIDFFCRNRNLMVLRACNTRFLKIVFDSADIFDVFNISAYAQPAMKSIPRMLSQRWNSFRLCSVCDEIRSAYAQCAMKFVPRMLSMNLHVKTVLILPLADHARKFVPRLLSVFGFLPLF